MHGGTSASAKLVLFGEWDVRAALGPVLQWSGVVWTSRMAPERAHIRYPALVSLRHQANASSAVDWKRSRGPLSRVAMCLRGAEWSAPEA
eukprot:4193206-Pyramimonas_sp.AAC.1